MRVMVSVVGMAVEVKVRCRGGRRRGGQGDKGGGEEAETGVPRGLEQDQDGAGTEAGVGVARQWEFV